MTAPAPLTPADCDLRDFAFMPLDATRLLDSDLFALATGDEFKAALSLWCKAWLQVPAASLPDDDRVLAHLSGAGAKWKKVKEMALRGFVKCSDGRLYHSTVAEKANASWAKKTSYRDRSKKGNAKRWGSQKDGDEQPQKEAQERSLKDASAIPEGVLEPPKGEGEGEYSVAKATGAAAPPVDEDARFWADAKAYLGRRGVKNPGALVGKWSRDHGQQETARVITQAQLERPADLIPYVEACFRRRAERREDVPLC